MNHRKIDRPHLIRRGTPIAFVHPRSEEVVVGVFLRYELGCMIIDNGPNVRTFYVPAANYRYSLACSPDMLANIEAVRDKIRNRFGVGLEQHYAESLLNLSMDMWAACEKHYGVTYEGSAPTDQRRKVAFLILKGDPQALDLATDVLGG